MVDERRQQLLGAQLRGLVGDHLGTPIDAEPNGFGAGAALMVGTVAWASIDGPAHRRLGAALAWAHRQGATTLNVVAAEGGGTVARRALGFSLPIEVWFPDGRMLLPVVPDACVPSVEPGSEHLTLVALIEEAGAEPRIEHGVVTGEVRGLEVCRVVDEPTVGNFVELSDVAGDAERMAENVSGRDSGGVILEVGVGANDREAFQLLHGHLPTVEALAGVVAAVAEHRSVATRQHPLNRMAVERFLRWQVEREPDRLGLESLAAVESPVVRLSMKHGEPCVGQGLDTEGRSVLVVFSSGVDLDLMPFVADAVQCTAETFDRVIVTLPERDLVSITADLSQLLTQPVELIALPDEV
mgnify:CR=1 FL=1